MAGRNRKPTAIKILEGNRGRRNLNTREPQFSEGIQSRPEWLLPEAKREWVRVCGELDALGLLQSVDRAVLAAHCQAWARWVECEQYLTKHGLVQWVESKANGSYRQQQPEVVIGQKYYQLMLSAASKLGISPADRSRVTAPERKRDDLNELLG